MKMISFFVKTNLHNFLSSVTKVLMFSRGSCDGLIVASHRGTWLST